MTNAVISLIREPSSVRTSIASATLAGSLGALTALVGSSPEWRLAYPLAACAGLFVSSRLSSAVEVGHELSKRLRPPLHRSRGIVTRLSALFALDSLGGGFVPQTFIAYLFARKYDASPHTLAIVFFAIGILQALSFQAAVRLADRIGLLRTMVFTHLPLESVSDRRCLRAQPGERDRAPARTLRPSRRWTSPRARRT
jgi:predicted MFS family arabinose efflux permease